MNADKTGRETGTCLSRSPSQHHFSQVQPSPTTGMLNLIPPLFHGSGSRAAATFNVLKRAVPVPEASVPESRRREAAKERPQTNTAPAMVRLGRLGTTPRKFQPKFGEGGYEIATGWRWSKLACNLPGSSHFMRLSCSVILFNGQLGA